MHVFFIAVEYKIHAWSWPVHLRVVERQSHPQASYNSCYRHAVSCDNRQRTFPENVHSGPSGLWADTPEVGFASPPYCSTGRTWTVNDVTTFFPCSG